MNTNIKMHKQLLSLAVLSALGGGMLSGPLSAQAAVIVWNCTDDFWHTAGCWEDTGTVPAPTDEIFVSPVNAANTFLRFDGITGAQSVQSLNIDSGGPETIDLVQTGGSLTVTSYAILGGYGFGTFTHSGGTHAVNELYIGHFNGGSGTYNLSGSGSLTAATENVGVDGTGSFFQSGGTHAVNTLLLGNNIGGSGNYYLIGGNLTAGSEIIGLSGTGFFNQDSGANTVTSSLTLGSGSTGNGSYDLNSGSLTATAVTLGYFGTGTFTQYGGTLAVVGLSLGDQSSGNGTYRLVSGNLTASYEYIGLSGTGTFLHIGGTNTVNNSLYLGYDSNGSINGTYSLSGGNLTAGSEYIGHSGSGSFTQSGGTHTVTNHLYLGHNNGSDGSYHLSGGNLTADTETIGVSGVGIFTQTGGIHTVNNTMTLAANAGGIGIYDLTGGTLTVNNGITNNTGGNFNVGAGTTVTVGGPGFINHGQINGPGTIAGNITSDGTIAPGNSPGMLAIAGNYTQTALGSFAVEIGGLLAGTEYDVLNVSGTANLDGSLNVSLFDLGSGLFAPKAGDSFDILTAELLQGSFSMLSYAALLDPNLRWQINYLSDAIGTTDVVRLSVVNAVPVPPAVWLFGSGLLGLIGVARRRNANGKSEDKTATCIFIQHFEEGTIPMKFHLYRWVGAASADKFLVRQRALSRRRSTVRRLFPKIAAFLALLATSTVRGEAVLNDWCLNINGDTTLACNPVSAASLPGTVDASAFDLTTNDPPGTPNTLGSLAITLGPGSGQYVLAYFDYDLNFGASGSFQDFAAVHGSLPPGLSFDIADPSENLFGDFAANALTNGNTVATGSGPPTPCCDVAWALGIGGLDVPPASQEMLIFAITNLPPQSGFYLQQTNMLSGESIYFTATVTTPVPLPGSLVLLVSALAPFAMVGLARARARSDGSFAWRFSQ